MRSFTFEELLIALGSPLNESRVEPAWACGCSAVVDTSTYDRYMLVPCEDAYHHALLD